MTGLIEPMVGRYVHVEIYGTMHRIYFEENGAGIPLVCLHTAGSDGRQWRHLLADEAFANNFRILEKEGYSWDAFSFVYCLDWFFPWLWAGKCGHKERLRSTVEWPIRPAPRRRISCPALAAFRRGTRVAAGDPP